MPCAAQMRIVPNDQYNVDPLSFQMINRLLAPRSPTGLLERYDLRYLCHCPGVIARVLGNLLVLITGLQSLLLIVLTMIPFHIATAASFRWVVWVPAACGCRRLLGKRSSLRNPRRLPWINPAIRRSRGAAPRLALYVLLRGLHWIGTCLAVRYF